MTPPPFHINDVVEVIGPSVSGQTKDIGHKFTIYQIHNGRKFYTNGQEYNYPASSLRLVYAPKIGDYVEVLRAGCGKPKGFIFRIESIRSELLSCVPVRYYTADNLPMWTADELRKLTRSEVDVHLAPELNMGDWVRVIGPCGDEYIPYDDDPEMFQISEIRAGKETTYRAKYSGDPGYPAKSLRKLTPSEIEEHLNPKLKIGDWVQHDDIVFQIADISPGESFCLHRSGKRFEKWYNPAVLRKLTPEEIEQHAQKSTLSIMGTLAAMPIGFAIPPALAASLQKFESEMAQVRKVAGDPIEARLSAIEKQQGNRFMKDLEYDKRLAAIENCGPEQIPSAVTALKTMGQTIAEMQEQIDRMQRSIECKERFGCEEVTW